MFSIGDAVSYPMHGVGIIEAIESQLTLGEMVSYYVLRFEDGRLTTMIPVNQAERSVSYTHLTLPTTERV